jgi:hypothetical protein
VEMKSLVVQKAENQESQLLEPVLGIDRAMGPHGPGPLG